jgi:tryptophan-rich sensory protein
MRESYTWYLELIKPSWAPPAWIFGPVWTVLYVIIAISFGAVFFLTGKKQVPSSVALPFGLNLAFNFAFTPLQFGLRNNVLAAIDVVLVLLTLVWSMSVIWRHRRWVALVNIPYLLWVSFATVLQLTITWLNSGQK